MKKVLLVFPMFLAMSLLAQQVTVVNKTLKDNRREKMKRAESISVSGNQVSKPLPAYMQPAPSGQRASVVNSIPIGTSGNLLTVFTNEANQLFWEEATNSLTFIHRANPTTEPTDNLGQYRYDLSTDGGSVWNTNIGTFTPTPDNSTVNGRFPEAVIYNPAGNTDPNNQYLVYNGTWHDGSNGSWEGHLRGVVKTSLPFDLANSTEDVATINGGNVLVGSGMCRGKNNTFWKANLASSSSFGSNDQIVSGITVDKGIFNTTTNNVDWTTSVINIPFELSADGTQNIVTSLNIAFDPTGTIGWISMLGDIKADANTTYEPIFYFTPDSGDHWYGPTQVSLSSLPGLIAELGDSIVDGSDAASGIPTTAFDADLVVDAWGNAHLITVVGNGGDYSIEAATYDVYDITSYSGTPNLGCGWAAVHLADINTLRGTFTAEEDTEDNRPQASTSTDGTKVFVFWNESDIDIVGSPDNNIPNLFGTGLDLTNNTMTSVKNFTEGDSLWGGTTVSTAGGVRGGVTYNTASPLAKTTVGGYNVPMVFTEIDYNSGAPLGSDGEPAQFFYISNIDFNSAEFTEALTVNSTANVTPAISLTGPDTLVLLQNSPFVDEGALAYVCGVGNIPVTVDSGNLNTAVVGTYTITYTATFGGATVTITRTVIIGAAPVAAFTYNTLTPDYRFQFIDQSVNTPTAWAWTFGDNSGSSQQNPIKTYSSSFTGPRQVCLVASNSFGSSAQSCQTINVIIGIDDPAFSSLISVFPNPAQDMLQVAFENTGNADCQVSLYNVLSQEVIPARSFTLNGKKSIGLDVSAVSPGLYFVKIQQDGQTAIKEVVIE